MEKREVAAEGSKALSNGSSKKWAGQLQGEQKGADYNNVSFEPFTSLAKT